MSSCYNELDDDARYVADIGGRRTPHDEGAHSNGRVPEKRNEAWESQAELLESLSEAFSIRGRMPEEEGNHE
jgi:hypothetical protein